MWYVSNPIGTRYITEKNNAKKKLIINFYAAQHCLNCRWHGMAWSKLEQKNYLIIYMYCYEFYDHIMSTHINIISTPHMKIVLAKFSHFYRWRRRAAIHVSKFIQLKFPIWCGSSKGSVNMWCTTWFIVMPFIFFCYIYRINVLPLCLSSDYESIKFNEWHNRHRFIQFLISLKCIHR